MPTNNSTTHPVVTALRVALDAATDNLPDTADNPAMHSLCRADVYALETLLADDGSGNPSILAYLPAE